MSVIILLFFTVVTAQWKILVKDYWPLTQCDDSSGTTEVLGMEVQLTTDALSNSGWKLGQDYIYECEQDWDLLWERISSEQNLMGALSGITINASRLDLYSFSSRTFLTGLILIVDGSKRQGMWIFFEGFSMKLWLFIMGITFFKGIFIWLFERDANDDFPNSFWKGLKEGIWYSFSGFFLANDKDLRAIPSRIITLGYWFMILILIAAYTANITVLVSADLSRITNVNAVNNLLVQVEPIYAAEVAKYGAYTQQTAIYYPDVLQQAIDDLRDGDLAAIVYEKIPAQTIVNQHPECDILHTEKYFYEVNYAMLMGASFPQNETEVFNYNLHNLQENSKYMKELSDKYIHDNNDCEAADAEFRFTFVEFAGLWILIAGAIGLGIIIILVDHYRKWRAKKNGTEADEQIPSEEDPEIMAQIRFELTAQKQQLDSLKKLI